MNFPELYSMQDKLDQKIAAQQGIESHSMLDERILALLVEIGELANETRSFKFWSTKAASPKDVILEEFIDCMHFLLSIGNFKGYAFMLNDLAVKEDKKGKLNDLFIEFFRAVCDFQKDQRPGYYILLWDLFMSIGKKLGFTAEEMNDAYMIKNSINHQRQAQGY